MEPSTYRRYLESEVLSADPIKLVTLLYRGAIEATAAARRHLAAGEIQPRSQQILRAWDIVGELVRSLDHEQGGDLSRQLADLYSYIQQRLLDANSHQDDTALAEVENLLSTLAEAWRELQATSQTAALTVAPAAQPAPPPAAASAAQTAGYYAGDADESVDYSQNTYQPVRAAG